MVNSLGLRHTFGNHSTSQSSTVIFARTVLWLATFQRRNIAQDQALVVKLVVQESGWALALLLGELFTKL